TKCCRRFVLPGPGHFYLFFQTTRERLPHLVQFSIYAVGETPGENDDVEAVDEDEIEAYITTVEVDLPKKGGTYDFELSSAPKT
ncbi:MAG: hypothetical protein ABGZ17_13035, partial [Planctomycetaceae bacterium]